MLLVYSTAHSLEMSTGQDFPAQHSLEGICFLSCSTQFPAELRSATKSPGMKQGREGPCEWGSSTHPAAPTVPGVRMSHTIEGQSLVTPWDSKGHPEQE